MLLINFVRALITLAGLGVILLTGEMPIELHLPVVLVVLTGVFTLGDVAETKLVELFNREARTNP